MNGEHLETLSTETPNPRSSDMDQMTARELLLLMNQEDHNAVRAVSEAIPAIEMCIRDSCSSSSVFWYVFPPACSR